MLGRECVAESENERSICFRIRTRTYSVCKPLPIQPRLTLGIIHSSVRVLYGYFISSRRPIPQSTASQQWYGFYIKHVKWVFVSLPHLRFFDHSMLSTIQIWLRFPFYFQQMYFELCTQFSMRLHTFIAHPIHLPSSWFILMAVGHRWSNEKQHTFSARILKSYKIQVLSSSLPFYLYTRWRFSCAMAREYYSLEGIRQGIVDFSSKRTCFHW